MDDPTKFAHIRRWRDEDDALQVEGGDPTAAVVALTPGRRRRLRIGGKEIRRAEVRNGREDTKLILILLPLLLLLLFFFFSSFIFLFLLLYYSASFSSPRELKIRRNQFYTLPPGDISSSTEENSNIPIAHTKRMHKQGEAVVSRKKKEKE